MGLTTAQQLAVFLSLICIFKHAAEIGNRFYAIYKDLEVDIAFGADNWF